MKNNKSSLMKRGNRGARLECERVETRCLLAIAVSNLNSFAASPIVSEVATFEKDDVTNPGTATAKINWGDGAETDGVVQEVSDTSFRVSGSHTYAAPGVFALVVKVSGAESTSVAGQGSVTVASSALTGVGITSSAVVGQAKAMSMARFFDPVPGGQASDYLATVAFGDGTSGLGTISGPLDGQYTVSVTHTYAQTGTFGTQVAIARLNSALPGTSITSTVEVSAGGSIPGGSTNEFFGRLDPDFDTGASQSDNITRMPILRYEGNATPNSVVFVYARRFDHKEATLVARTVTGNNGYWSAQFGPLPDGRYVVKATVSLSGPGSATAPSAQEYVINSAIKPLVIDTIALGVVRVIPVTPLGRSLPLSKQPGVVQVVLSQDLSGFNPKSLVAGKNFVALAPPLSRIAPQPATSVTWQFGNTAQVLLKVAFPRKLPHHSSVRISGVYDIAGNQLAGVFHVNGTKALSRRLPYG